MLARMASRKAEIEDALEVKKWLDRFLLKFCVKFTQFQPQNRDSFRMPNPMKHFPQYMYHLRRSGLINPFGSPPDQSIYMKTCLERESLVNCTVMIQSALFKYSTDVVDEDGNI
jgi:protein transport protein SEC23